MRRLFGLMMIVGLLVGGAAACSSSDSSKTDSGSESGTSGGGTSSSNAKVKEYCKAVDDYVAKVKAAGTDPAKLQALTKVGTELGTKAQSLATANLSSADAQAVADCTKKSTEALQP